MMEQNISRLFISSHVSTRSSRAVLIGHVQRRDTRETVLR